MREFAYGQQYAWMLVIFSVMVVYCITCPLVTPFGKSRNGLVTCQIFSLVTVRKESGKNNLYGRGNAPHSRILARLVQIGELARRLCG